MKHKDRDRIQYAFDFAPSHFPNCRSQASGIDTTVRDPGVVVEFVDLKTRALRDDAVRRVRAHGIFKVG